MALYYATNGANWTNNNNWLSPEPLSTWYGITTDTSGRVTRLYLGDNGLSGQIPDLSALTKLTNLSLGRNQLNGPIPDLSALTQLTSLSLSSNPLGGPIPDLSALTKLASLSLNYNELTGEIPDLSALTNMTSLSLASNQLTGRIPDLSGLTQLTGLYLNHNKLSGPIPDLSTLTNLRSLALTATQLCLPDGANLSHPNSVIDAHLQSLNLPSCTPAGPDERAALVALYNATDGANWTHNDNWLSAEPIDTWYRVNTDAYGHVARLVLQYNGLNGPIPDLSALPSLTTLFLANNQLSGEIPELSAFTRLATLNLDGNDLSGPIPDLSALTNLGSLALGSNDLSGPIPDLSSLTNLRILSLARNPLGGQIPDLSSLTNLRILSLYDSDLSGQIPDLSALTNLTSLALSHNQLTGPFPDLSTLTKLRGLYISGNQLSGTFPDLSALTGLRVLSLRSSQLQGQISDLSALTYLAEVDLSDNQLTGQFPDLSALSYLTQLFLTDNQLTGQFPDLSALTNLQHLGLQSNQLSGHLTDLSALTKLRSLDLGSNQLTGEIPDLSALTSLTRLDINNNRLTGQLPDLSLLTSLTRVDLSNNQLTGPIVDLSFLTNLTNLYLDNNMLTGPVPDLTGLTNLTRLDLTDNLLCLPAGFSFSGLHTSVAAHLNSLSLQTCTSTETMVAPGMPQNLTATVGVGQVTLTWDAVANAASYELRAWDSLDRQWSAIGGILTDTTTYTHTVLTDGRNYHFQVRARNANDVEGAWSERVFAAVVTPRFPPPPQSLGLDLFYQKYLDVGGVVVVAPTEVSDDKIVQVRDVITSTLSERSDLLDALADNGAQISIYPNNPGAGGITQLPELWFLTSQPLGYVHKSYNLLVAGVPEEDENCGTLVHEFAHMVHYIIDEQTDGEDFNSRLQAAYQAALNAGLWQELYARRNPREYWAEAVRFWFWESLPPSLSASYSTLADYDPEVAKLVEEVFGEATLASYCKP